MNKNDLTHFDDEGKTKMVDISNRQITDRKATVSGRVYFQKKYIILFHQMELLKAM